MEFMVLKSFVSSAKVAIVELLTVLERRFSYNRNSNGPSIESCGTPDVTAFLLLLHEPLFADVDYWDTMRTNSGCFLRTQIRVVVVEA